LSQRKDVGTKGESLERDATLYWGELPNGNKQNFRVFCESVKGLGKAVERSGVMRTKGGGRIRRDKHFEAKGRNVSSSFATQLAAHTKVGKETWLMRSQPVHLGENQLKLFIRRTTHLD